MGPDCLGYILIVVGQTSLDNYLWASNNERPILCFPVVIRKFDPFVNGAARIWCVVCFG